MPAPETKNPPAPTVPKFTTKEENTKHLDIVLAGRLFTKKENNPKDVVYKPVHVTPKIIGISMDRGEFINEFYVEKCTRTPEGKTETISDINDSERAFFIGAEHFLKEFVPVG